MKITKLGLVIVAVTIFYLFVFFGRPSATVKETAPSPPAGRQTSTLVR